MFRQESALKKHGFWQISKRTEQVINLARKLEKEFHDSNNELVQKTINILRDWVLDQTKPFTIMDIYGQPTLSAKLEVRIPKMLVIDEALLKLGCTIEQGQEDVEFIRLKYTPPVVMRVHRDLIYT